MYVTDRHDMTLAAKVALNLIQLQLKVIGIPLQVNTSIKSI